MFGFSIDTSAAPRVASYSYSPGTDPNADSKVDIAQALHRIHIINAWAAIPEGSRVLEIGCGQGNCTIVLAEAVGSSGKVDAIDPAPQDYGAPVTLGEAQSWISHSAIGNRVSWHEAGPEEFLKKTAEEGLKWDVAVLTHCIWYFKSSKTLENILRALRGRVKTVCIAEYALQATNPAAAAHLLAVLTRASLESQRDSDENVQNSMGPTSIKEVARTAGWELGSENLVVPEAGLSDGFWETNTVHKVDFLRSVDLHVKDERLAAHLKASREAVIATAALNGGLKEVQTMDVWVGTFV